jgi:hypothetical protein
VVAVAVGLADQLESEIRKTLLHAGDQRVDAVKAVAAHQRLDIFCVGGCADYAARSASTSASAALTIALPGPLRPPSV